MLVRGQTAILHDIAKVLVKADVMSSQSQHAIVHQTVSTLHGRAFAPLVRDRFSKSSAASVETGLTSAQSAAKC